MFSTRQSVIVSETFQEPNAVFPIPPVLMLPFAELSMIVQDWSTRFLLLWMAPPPVLSLTVQFFIVRSA